MHKVKVIPSKDFIKVLEELSPLSDAPPNIKNTSFTKCPVHLTTADIKWCHKKIKERGIPHRIHALLNGSKLYLPKYHPPTRSPELEARIERLKAEQANREYREMTKNIMVTQFEAASLSSIGQEMKEVNKQLVTGVQYLVSVVGTFFAIFVGSGFVVHDHGVRALLATVSAVMVAIAEIYFVIRDDIAQEARLQAKNK